MPTKNKERKLKQKQRQSQNVKVIVNLAEKQKRKRKAKRRAAKEAGIEPSVVGLKAFPPQIIYPSPPVVFSNFEAKPAPPISLAQTVTEQVRPPAGILEDIGNIGTEGVGVEILDKPTKKETLAELETPIGIKPSKIPVPLAQTLKSKLPSSMTEGLSTESDFGISAREVMPEPRFIQTENGPVAVPPIKLRKARTAKDIVRDKYRNDYFELTGQKAPIEWNNTDLKKGIDNAKKIKKGGENVKMGAAGLESLFKGK